MAKAQKITLKATPLKGAGKKDKEVELTLQGELNIVNSQKVRDFLFENLSKYNHFTLIVGQVNSIDLTTIQLLQRFVWDAQEKKKTVNMHIDLPEDDRLLLERSGFGSILSSSK